MDDFGREPSGMWHISYIVLTCIVTSPCWRCGNEIPTNTGAIFMPFPVPVFDINVDDLDPLLYPLPNAYPLPILEKKVQGARVVGGAKGKRINPHCGNQIKQARDAKNGNMYTRVHRYVNRKR